MQRIALILLLYVLLTNAPHMRDKPPLPSTPLTVVAESLPLPDARGMRDYGPLRLTGLWHLHSAQQAFGGVSGLLAEADGRFIALGDSGEAAIFRPGEQGLIA